MVLKHKGSGKRRPLKLEQKSRSLKRHRDDVDAQQLESAVAQLDLTTSYSKFADLPLSNPTKAGLKTCHFQNLTDIQSKAIPLALKGRDILGAAKTGSGKTLAFLIPVLENLYRAQCVGPDAGLGAMIISPTRELAIQIFDVLRKIGRHGHLFAAGLVIGGKSLQEEQAALTRMNIVVCTPGRMLQHLSQTASFNVDSLQMLVLDEADRIMDMGFQSDVDSIIEYMPSERQTLLFSATQTKKVSDLARLSLRDPEYVAVHESAASATPSTLQQNYIVTPLSSKLDTLWSFLQANKKAKTLIFLSSGKQVRFVYSAFAKLQPGVPLLHLHGRQKQSARLGITQRFSRSQHAALFATDVAARGLDFPAVDWVIQVDCPEDADTYIHRVGRTARYERVGRAVLFLDPSEESGMVERLATKKVPVERIGVRQKKQQSIQNQLQAICFKDPELKYLGQKAFISYVKSLYLQRDKAVFDVENYQLDAFADSLGLPGAPRIKFLKGDVEAQNRLKNAPRAVESDSELSDKDDKTNNEKPSKPPVRTKYDRMFERRNQDVLAEHYAKMVNEDPGSDEDSNAGSQDNLLPSNDRQGSTNLENDLFSVKRHISVLPIPPESDETPLLIDSNRKARALKTRKRTAALLTSSGALQAKHFVFDETGNARPAVPEYEDETAVGRDVQEKEAARRQFVDRAGEELRTADVADKATWKEKRLQQKIRRKERQRAEAEAAVTGVGGEDEDDGPRLPVMERPFEELRDLYPSEEEYPENGAGDDEVRPSKKRKGKKWFEREVASERGEYAPQTLEDLENMASGLLAKGAAS